MSAKKTNAQTPEKDRQQVEASRITVRIDRLVDNEDTNIRAVASANIGGAFAIHGIRIMDSHNGLFVQMPQDSYRKKGKMEYREICHPIKAEARSELNDKLMEAYKQMRNEVESEREGFNETEEETAFEQSM